MGEAPPRPRRWWEPYRVHLSYLAAALGYIGLGVLAKEVFAWWIYALLFLLGWFWVIPALVRRLR